MMREWIAWIALTVVFICIFSLCRGRHKQKKKILYAFIIVGIVAGCVVIYTLLRQASGSANALNQLNIYWLCRLLWENELLDLIGGALSSLLIGFAVNYFWEERKAIKSGQYQWGNGKLLKWFLALAGVGILVSVSYVVYCNSAVMPDLTGETFSDAKSMLKEAGFVNFKLISEDGNEEGVVDEQFIAAGTVFRKTDQSILVVMDVPETAYEMYLYSEYKKLSAMITETEISATINFDATEVSITAYLNGVQSGDTVQMSQSDAETWKVKVIFEEEGIYEVVATAIMADGDRVEESLVIEVDGMSPSTYTEFFQYFSNMFGGEGGW